MKVTLPLFFLVLIFSSALVIAEPRYRGFQLGLDTLTDEEINSLQVDWKSNIVRVPIGNDALMDGLSGEAYLEMIAESLDKIDLLIPKFEAKQIKVILNLYSPPGGFETRISPSHYAMFSNPSLQEEYINVWKILAERYKNNANIVSYDLANEPALRKSLFKNSSAISWPELIQKTILAIREIDQSKQILVKAIYGNPGNLRLLPKISDPNFCYSFHVYPDMAYTNQGFNGTPINRNPPKASTIMNRSFLPIQKILAKYPRKERGNICFNIGEFAVVRWAPQADIYLTRLLKIIEKGRIPSLQNGRSQKINLQSWTFHAFDESEVWDPRGSTTPNDLSFPEELPPHGEVLKSFMHKNQ